MSDSTRRVLRTIVQVTLALAVTLPILLDQAGIDPSQIPWLATVVAIAGVIARVMQSPAVDAILEPLGLSKGVPGRHEAGEDVPPPDAGRASTVDLVIGALVALMVVIVVVLAWAR